MVKASSLVECIYASFGSAAAAHKCSVLASFDVAKHQVDD
jgi:hypothetical protein